MSSKESSSQTASASTKPPPDSKPHPQDLTIAPWKDAKPAVRNGDLIVAVTAVHVGKVRLTRLGDARESGDENMVVHVGILNRSDSTKHDYRGWSTKAFDLETNLVATAADEFDNQYKRVTFGVLTEVQGQLQKGDSIYPEKSLTDILVFEVPIPKARELRLSLPAEAIGAKGTIRLKIPLTDRNREGFIYNVQDELNAKRAAEERARAEEAKAEKRRKIEAKLAKPDPARDEKAAESLLGNAQKLLRSGKGAAYRETLQKIVEKYPNTKAAETARSRLK